MHNIRLSKRKISDCLVHARQRLPFFFNCNLFFTLKMKLLHLRCFVLESTHQKKYVRLGATCLYINFLVWFNNQIGIWKLIFGLLKKISSWCWVAASHASLHRPTVIPVFIFFIPGQDPRLTHSRVNLSAVSDNYVPLQLGDFLKNNIMLFEYPNLQWIDLQ